MSSKFPRDRFDDVARVPSRVGAHRDQQARSSWWVGVLLALGVVLVLVAAGVFYLNVLGGNLNEGLADGDGQPGIQQEAEPEKTVAPEIVPDIGIFVLYGTGDVTVGDQAASKLESVGFLQTSVLASDKDDVLRTVVYFARPADEAAARGVAEALQDSVQDPIPVQRDDSFAVAGAELVVVIGADFISDND